MASTLGRSLCTQLLTALGAGSSWLSVYAYLDPIQPHRRGWPDAGWGISHFTARVGWACDNVVNFQVVLASGAPVDVNPTSHPLLFRALKGGGNNFGVVTRNRLFWTGTYTPPPPRSCRRTFDTLKTSFYNFTILSGVVWSIAFEPLPIIISSYASSQGGNPLETSSADGSACILLISALWPNSSSNSVVEQTAARSVGAQTDALAAAQGMLHRFRYTNCADPSQSPLQSYGPQHFARLARASLAYDLQGVFQDNVPGGFKLT